MAAVPAPDTPGGPNFLRWLQFRVSGSTFECPSVYQLVKPIGKGGAQAGAVGWEPAAWKMALRCGRPARRVLTCCGAAQRCREAAEGGSCRCRCMPACLLFANAWPAAASPRAAAYGIVCAAIDSRSNQQARAALVLGQLELSR